MFLYDHFATFLPENITQAVSGFKMGVSVYHVSKENEVTLFDGANYGFKFKTCNKKLKFLNFSN